jgi:glutathione S-transferase
MMSLTLYGAPISPFVRKVRILLDEKRVPYSLEPVVPFPPTPQLLEMSPLGKIPALRDGDRTLPDSSVICAYLERKFPEPALLPKDDFEYARALWFEEYADGGMFPQIGPGVFMPLVVNPMIGRPRDPETAQKTVANELPRLFDYLEGELKGDYLVGNALSIGDIAVASQFVNLRHCSVKPDAARWPKLAAYVERIHSRPTFQAAIQQEEKLLQPRAAS